MGLRIILLGAQNMKFKPYEAVVFEPSYKVDWRHPLEKGEVVYFLGLIPNIVGHCIVLKENGRAVPNVHPQDFRKCREDEV